MYVYIQNEKNPNIRFQVMEYDRETGEGKLKGGFGTIITRNIGKDELKKRGYKIVRSEEPLSLVPPPRVVSDN